MSHKNPWLNEVLPPEVLSALSNNDPPKQDVIRTMRVLFQENPAAFSSVVEERIRDIDKQISALQQEKSQLNSRSNVRLAVKETYATICAPFRSIPRDVLQEIAFHSLDAHPSAVQSEAPWSLTHVSSKWRSVIINSPKFWTSLYLRVKNADHDSLVKHVQVVQAWFRRAGSLPIQLFLYVDCKLDSKQNGVYNFRLFLKALAPWASRINHLGIGGLHWINLMTKFVDIKWDLSRLVRLDFLGQLGVAWDAEMEELEYICNKITLFCSAKHLITVVASQELSTRLHSLAFIPWSQLQHLTLREDQSSELDLLALLKQCPRLQTASLYCFERGFLAPESEEYSVTRLEKLQLDYDIFYSRYSELARFFSKTSFPALTHLCLTFLETGIEPENFMLQLDPILLFPSLQSFSLMEDTRLPIHLILDFLRKMPRLQTFSMQISGSFHDEHRTDLNMLCESLTVDETRYNYLPLLEECMFLRSGNIEPLDATLIAHFIQSRTLELPANFKRLKRLTFWGNFSFMTDLWEEVVRPSGLEPSVEININLGSRSSHDYPQPLETGLMPFSNTNIHNMFDVGYAAVVNHYRLWV